jgi:hypothetical protein
MDKDQYAVAALNELRNNILLLTTANEYLSDEVFLIKIGNNISRALEVLERDISSLKKEYPGKFVNDVDTDTILERIDNAAQRMLKPGKEIKDNNMSGALGKEMESYLISISKAVDDIRIKVHGSHTDRGRKGPAINVFSAFNGMLQSAGIMLVLGIKILACFIVLAGVAFAYLFFTIEKDTAFLNEIATSRALIKEKKEQIPRLEQEKQDLDNERKAMNRIDKMSREEKVAALDLELKIKKIDDTLDQLAAEISVQEKKIGDNQIKLDAFRRKTFITRLLKQ